MPPRAPDPPPPPCPKCGATLVRLGGAVLRAPQGEPLEVVHYSCPRCGRRLARRSQGELRETDADLSSG